MLAPPERRAADRKRKRRQLARERQDLHRVELWLTGRALDGIINQLRATRVLTDRQADDHHNVETALTAQIEKQGREWAR